MDLKNEIENVQKEIINLENYINKKAVEFITNEIDVLVEKIPKLLCTYVYDNFDNKHMIIIIEPENLFNKDSFIEYKNEFINRFIDIFPKYGLMFLNSDEFTYIVDSRNLKPICVKKGEKYEKK